MLHHEQASDAHSTDGSHSHADDAFVELGRRVREGDAEALAILFRQLRERLRRIVAIRLAARLARVLEQEELPEDLARAALIGLRAKDLASEAGVLRCLARLVEHEVRSRSERTLDEARERGRSLRLDAEGHVDAQRARREALEHLVDRHVAELEPEPYREVLLLRDYCGADWELVREHLGLLSVEAARELHRRSHERLARRMRPHLRKKA